MSQRPSQQKARLMNPSKRPMKPARRKNPRNPSQAKTRRRKIKRKRKKIKLSEIIAQKRQRKRRKAKAANQRRKRNKSSTLDELALDRYSSEITHLLMREDYLWDKKEVSMPASAIDFSDRQVICLKLDKAAVKEQPPVSVKRSEEF